MKSLKLLVLTSVALLIGPLEAFAHGSAEEHANENAVNYWSYVLIASLIILVIFIMLFFTTRFNRKMQRRNIYKWGSILSSLLVIISLIAFNVGDEEKVTFTHIHGLGYTSDGEEILVPAHDGLKIYKDGSWAAQTKGAKHDYMGFNMFKDGFYSSGHPAPDSDLANPLGIVKSTDKGKTIEKLALYKEVDFHGMTVGYMNEDIYVFNPVPNSQMDQPGFYYSTDEAQSWKQSKLAGLEGQAMALAAHPTKEGIVAVGTDEGIYLSKDHGNSFEKLSISSPVTAVSFGHQNNLLVATQSDGVDLFQIDLSTQESVEFNVPDLGEDAISYIKQNPANRDELVFATNKRDIYISNDDAATWNQLVDEGVATTD